MQKLQPYAQGARGIQWIGGEVSSSGELSHDNDGYFTEAPTALIDLSDLMSQNTGRQCPQTANYRVKGIKLSLVNVDDTVDNNASAFFQGVVGYRTPTSHLVDAVSAARSVHKEATMGTQGSTGYLLSSKPEYSGFRFGLNGNTQIRFPTDMSAIQGWSGSSFDDEANLSDMITAWSLATEELPPMYNNALWNSRVGISYSTLEFSCGISNAAWDIDDGALGGDEPITMTHINDYEFQTLNDNHLEVFGGLMFIQIINCNTQIGVDLLKDEYRLKVQIDVEGWTEW